MTECIECGGGVAVAGDVVAGEIVSCSDDFFADCSRMLKAEAPVFIDGKFDDHGKWMDGWETRRRREPGNDWIVVALGAAGLAQKIEVDTAHFKGNYPDRCSLQAARLPPDTRDADILADCGTWKMLVPEQKLEMDSIHIFEGAVIDADFGPVTHVRLNIFPDGGVSRLRVFGPLAQER